MVSGNDYGRELCAIAQGIEGASELHPRVFKGRLCSALIERDWFCNLRVRVASRGTNDHYRGILDLVAFPPFPEGVPRSHKNRPPPVLVELEKHHISHKARAKLAAWHHPRSAAVVILTRAQTADSIPEADLVLCLG